MGEKKKLFKFLFVPILLARFFVFQVDVSQAAANVNFSQSILPVKFVYLGNDGSVRKIWENISPRDDFYVIKFFSVDNGQEMVLGSDVSNNYRKKLVLNECHQELASLGSPQLLVQLVEKGDRLEEIHTFI